MASLKNKTISGIIWALLQRVGGRGISLIATIILARILTPKAFGLIGMLAIFIQLSQTIIQAGFREALIQKKEPDEEDYSSVFYINLVVGIIFYSILYFSAPLIADFYHQPILINLTRVLALIFVINAFSYVQEAKLAKEMRFKTLMIIHLPSTVISGIVAIIMAMTGFGVWSIVGQQLVMRLAFTIQIWFYAKWIPLRKFSTKKVKGLFSFGGKLLISRIIQTVFKNIYLIVIGKWFPVSTLGYYQNAKKLVDLPTQTLSQALRDVTFSSFSIIQDDNKKLKEGYRKVVQQMVFWLCPMLIFAAALARPLFSFVLTDKWLPAVPFFQLLCVVGVFYPLNSYNLNILNVKGRSDLVLKLEIIKKIITIIGIVFTIPIGVWALIMFQSINAVFAYFLNSIYSGRFINYPLFEQIKDVAPTFLWTGLIAAGLFFLSRQQWSDLPDVLQIVIGFTSGFGLYGFIAWKTNAAPFQEFLGIIKGKMKFLQAKWN